MRRQKHGLSHYTLSTFDMGQLVPVSNFEVIPGDSVRMSTSCLIRVSPLLTPVMHPVTVRIHHWFVPYRILWTGWEKFITGGSDGLGDGVGSPPGFAGVTFPAGSVADYFGIPPGVAIPATTPISALPFRAYNKIWNEFYRDQDLESAAAEDDSALRGVAWEKDIFTSARPWTQKGPAVTLPASVITASGDLQLRDGAAGNIGTVTQNNADGNRLNRTNPGTGTLTQRYSSGLAVAATAVNDMRRAFALQRYQEARAQYGSRYTEYLRYLGVRSSDARLQRPEYLGGGRATISFSEVLRTGDGGTPSAANPIGDMQGHGISAMRSRRWIRFFEEHGIVMTLASIRPRTMYVNGIEKKWMRKTKEDFWQKELELIGQQEVLNSELWAAAPTVATFGYQDRYYDYRHLPSYVTGDFRTTLNDWHMGRIFAAQPVLNSSFIQCVPTKRIHAEQTQDVIWGMFSHSVQARRMVGKKTIGRLF